MSFDAPSHSGFRARINITPLVDVVLVLLIIFMVLSPSVLKETDMIVPEQQSLEPGHELPSEQLTAAINTRGEISINQQPVPLPELGNWVGNVMTKRAAKDRIMFFDIEDGANYGQVLQIIDTCRGAGLRTVGFVENQ